MRGCYWDPYKGRARTLSEEQADQLRARAAAGVPKAELARQFGIHRATVYHYLQTAGAASAAGGGPGALSESANTLSPDQHGFE